MLLQPITVQFSKSTIKPSVYTLRYMYKMYNFDLVQKVPLHSFPEQQNLSIKSF